MAAQPGPDLEWAPGALVQQGVNNWADKPYPSTGSGYDRLKIRYSRTLSLSKGVYNG